LLAEGDSNPRQFGFEWDSKAEELRR
jgi:hypothetical protein